MLISLLKNPCAERLSGYLFGFVLFGEPPPCTEGTAEARQGTNVTVPPAWTRLHPGLAHLCVPADFLGDQPFSWLRDRLQASGTPQKLQLCQRFPKDNSQMSPVLL